jgi:hypothetical protein
VLKSDSVAGNLPVGQMEKFGIYAKPCSFIHFSSSVSII